ncbi:MAG: DUF58 domain-containing protein [Bacteroidia bacterium]|nr:DUF58 domain-containing protein [Bacteroidia bacterium]
MQFIRALYINRRFYLLLAANVFLYVLGYFFPFVFTISKFFSIGIFAFSITDLLLIYSTPKGITASRHAPDRLSNGDENEITVSLKNNYGFKIQTEVIDEIPHQFQKRDFSFTATLFPGEEKIYNYKLRPVKRGEYHFGRLNIYASCMIRFFNKRYVFDRNAIVPVYPSFLQMKKYELLAISNRLTEAGIKKIRSIGRHSEFDQIRKYNTDDDYRTINWKATARKGEIMVNQYQEEKSQHVYNIIDMGRVMKMPFEGMTLLDYSINASLVLSNIALYKHDKAGIITFTDKINTFLTADRRYSQMMKILEFLYKQETNFAESNYELLCISVKHNINQRSLLLLYTNFESGFSLQRQMKYLRMLSEQHLLVVIFFMNTEIQKALKNKTTTMEDIYIKTIAEKLIYEKKQIVKTLHKNGIHAILTEPQNLTVNTINKYLELKSIGLI